MNYYEVAPTKIIRANQPTFTYSSESALAIGTLVVIPVGKRHLPGLVIQSVKKPSYTTRPITSCIDETPVPLPLLEAMDWLHTYYATPLATVLQTALPRGLTTTRRGTLTRRISPKRDRTTIVFNDEQVSALETIRTTDPGTFLLQGVTGSGKTEIYKQVARNCIEKGKSVIVLTPEIALTPQLVAEFSESFNDIIITHSNMTESQRHLAWLEALHSDEPRVVIGPRSALFMPLRDVGAIIVDEAHEPSYKQEQAPRYSALRLATVLGRAHGAKVLFGSATPSVADRYLAEHADRPLLYLTKRARTDAATSVVKVIDMKQRSQFKKHRFLSDSLLQSIEQNISSQTQTLIFHNRRGSAQTTLCENCGWTAECPRCFVPLTLHSDAYELRCHICDYNQRVPTSCPVCHHANIVHKGIGTKMIEAELRRLFPKAKVARFDSDTEAGQRIEETYEQLYRGKIDIAIGTQVVAKGLDLPKLRTVGVIQADSGLVLPDYVSEERVFQLLSQVVGRVGRNQHATNVIIQSYQPTHPAILYGAAQDYESFYRNELAQRQKAKFPPFVYLLKLTCVYKTENTAIQSARKLAKELSALSLPIEILGPTPSFRERQGDTYRWQLLVKSKSRHQLLTVLSHVPVAHWQFELDPSSLL